MAHEAQQFEMNPDEVQLGALTPRMLGVGILLAVVGGALGLGLGLTGGEEGTRVFFHAYLVAFVFYLSVTLGALFFTMLHHLSRSGWSVTLRRLAETLCCNVLLMALLALPLLLGLGHLYEWSHRDVMLHDAILQGKAWYLNTPGFVLRMGVYFAVWIFLAWYFRSRSVRQDASGDIALSRQMERVSTVGMVVFGLTSSFAAFDLLMSLNPHWFSTIFGVYFFAGAMLAFLVAITLLALWLQRWGKITAAITVEHYHDLGKLMFAFVFFWGYIAFSQYMLIWYANLPEETQFYIPRQIGPWVIVSLLLLVFHLAIPFVGMLSRKAKRRLGVFTFWALWVLLAHLLDLFYLVMPSLYVNEIPQVTGEHNLPQALQRLVISTHNIYELNEKYRHFEPMVNLPLEMRSLAMLLGLVVGMGGLYLISTTLILKRAALVPLRDPRLSESLALENI